MANLTEKRYALESIRRKLTKAVEDKKRAIKESGAALIKKKEAQDFVKECETTLRKLDDDSRKAHSVMFDKARKLFPGTSLYLHSRSAELSSGRCGYETEETAELQRKAEEIEDQARDSIMLGTDLQAAVDKFSVELAKLVAGK